MYIMILLKNIFIISLMKGKYLAGECEMDIVGDEKLFFFKHK